MPPKRLTLKEVNKVLKEFGQERLGKGEDYYYFYSGKAHKWPETAVMVNKLNQLTLDQWVEMRRLLASRADS